MADRLEAPSGCAVTVVFATRNRAQALGMVLESFAGLIAPDGGWKLVVVDNGSTDETSGLLRSYAGRLPVTVLSEPKAGKNRALNAALPCLDGGLVVLTDDDVLPRPDWLCCLQRAAIEHPEASVFGGTIVPHWSQPKPAWLAERAVPFTVLYSQQQRASGPCSYDAIFGPNMAVRSSVFGAGFRFAEDVGPNETRSMYAMGSETEFLRRVEAAGHTSWFAADAVVGHVIRPEQTEERWILQRGYRYGSGEGFNYVAANPGLGGALAWLPPRARLWLRAAIFSAASKVVAPIPRSAWRLKIRYQARVVAGARDRLRETLRNRGAIA